MGDRIFSNNANSTLAAGISSGATSLSLTSGGGALFPNPATGQSFSFTLVKNGTPTTFEICLCTARTTDTFTSIVRAQQGTTALSWSAGDFCYLYPTAGDLAQFVQTGDLQIQPGNFAVDVGSSSAYSVTLNPALTAHVIGMPIRFLAAHTNAAGATFNDGAGALPLALNGATIPAGFIVATGIYEVVYGGGGYFYVTNSFNVNNYLTNAEAAATYATIAGVAAEYGPLVSPTFTGNVGVPTLDDSSNTNLAASTAFVQNLLNAFINRSGSQTSGCFTIGTTADGIIYINYGLQTNSPGLGTPVVVYFQTAFPTACVAIIPASVPASDYGSLAVSEPQSSTTQFTLLNGVAGASTSWIAIGY